MTKGLTKGNAKLRAALRRRKFVRAYLAGGEGVVGNLAGAIRAAGYRYKTNLSAASQGSKMLGRPDVRREIQRYMDREGATTERILLELSRVAFSDMRDLAEWGDDGVQVRPSRLLDDHAAATVEEVEQQPTEHGLRVRVRLYDKLRALELLAKIRRAVGDDEPKEFTLIIGRADRVQVSPGPPGDGRPAAALAPVSEESGDAG